MSTTTIRATGLGYVKGTSSSSWNSAGAYQGQYTGSKPRVGVMLFGGLLNTDWSNQIISEIRMTLTFAGAGTDGEKTISFYRGAKSSIDGTGQSMIGAKIGDVKTGGDAYKSTLTITFSASKNASAFAALAAWMQSMTTNTLTIYRNETTDSTWSANYLMITAASMSVDSEPAGSGGALDRDEADAGEAVTLTITPIESDCTLTHAVEWTFGSYTSGLTDLADALTASFAFPLAWLDAIPDAEQGTAYCLLTTYEDGEEKAVRTIPLTLTVPDDIFPEFDVLIEPLGTTGSYYQYLGGAQISIIDPVTYYGATIASYSVKGAEDFTSDQQISQTPEFAESGEHAYTITVMDSRGRGYAIYSTIYVHALSAPQIDAFSVQRYAAKVDDSGETVYAENLSGGHVWFTIDATIDTAGGNNTPTAYILYGPAGQALSSRAEIPWTSGATCETTDDRTILTADIPLNSAYEFRLYVEDKHSVVSWPGRVEKSGAIMHFAGSGYGVSIGGFSGGTIADKRFDVAPEWSSHFPGGMYGYGGYRVDRAAVSEAIGISNSNFEAYSTARTPTISRAGPMVFMDGFAKSTADLSAKFDEIFATLPDWARPARMVSALQQGTGAAVWWLIVNTDGTVRISRYRTGADYAAADAGSQFTLSACWLSADAFPQIYSVSAELTGLTLSNGASSVTEGAAYVAKCEPELGKEVTSISITMGGADASGYYADNLIHIPIVTGDIVITAVAEETPAALIQVTDDGEGNVVLTEAIDSSLLHSNTDGDVDVTQYGTAAAGVTDDTDGEIIIG